MHNYASSKDYVDTFSDAQVGLHLDDGLQEGAEMKINIMAAERLRFELATLRHWLALSAFALSVFTATSGWCQATTGDLVGTVTDNSSAVIPSATATLTNRNIGASRTQKSTSAGEYAFNALQPGSYSLHSHDGFRSEIVANINIAAGVRSRINVTSIVGAISENVEVDAINTGLQTDSSL